MWVSFLYTLPPWFGLGKAAFLFFFFSHLSNSTQRSSWDAVILPTSPGRKKQLKCFFCHLLNCKEIILQTEGWCLIWNRCLDGGIFLNSLLFVPNKTINSKYGWHRGFFFLISSSISHYHKHSQDCRSKFQICVVIWNEIDTKIYNI